MFPIVVFAVLYGCSIRRVDGDRDREGETETTCPRVMLELSAGSEDHGRGIYSFEGDATCRWAVGDGGMRLKGKTGKTFFFFSAALGQFAEAS